MGDTTWANLTFPTELLDKVCELLDDREAEDADELGDDLSQFSYYEVNSGNMDDDEQTNLIAAGVPFDWDWGEGGDYGAGSFINRYTNKGELVGLTLYDNTKNPDLDALMKLVNDPEGMVAYVVEHYNSIQVLPWDNQVEYGKLYQMMQLVCPA